MKQTSTKAIGAFVLGAIVLAVVAITVLGSGHLLSSSHKYVLFFPGDVNGLRVGAPVKFRGVPIGSVTAIRLNMVGMPSLLTSSSSDSRIPVIIELNETQITSHGGRVNLANPETLREAIKRGLRGQLRMESVVTGLYYVSLDIVPGSPLVLALPPGSEYQEIPTVQTALEQAQGTLQRLIAKVDEADLPAMMTAASSAMKGIDRLVTSPSLYAAVDSLNGTEQNLSEAAHNMSQAAVSLRRLSDNLDSHVSPLMSTLQGTSRRMETTLASTDQTMTAMRTTAEPASPLVYRMNQTLDQVSDAARAVRELADYLKRNPGAIIRGRYANTDAK
jgi:ABC-type transporter Mla subunit MlaD